MQIVLEPTTHVLASTVYDDLRRIARRFMRSENAHHTLQPTALVHEAYLKLIGQYSVSWQNESHFLSVAATIMRRILVDHARGVKADKRGGGWLRVQFDEAFHTNTSESFDLVQLDEALKSLFVRNPRQAQIAELRYFGGLNVDDTARALSLSPATVKREWAVARCWLYRELENVAATH